MNVEKKTEEGRPLAFKKRKPKTYLLFLLLSFGIIGYAVALKYAPEYMTFTSQNVDDDFYAPHASCFLDPEF